MGKGDYPISILFKERYALMNRLQARYLKEHKAFIDHASIKLPYANKICVRFHKRPTYEGFGIEDCFHKAVNTLFMTLSNLLDTHVSCIIGYNDVVVSRSPHIHGIVQTDKPIYLDQVAKVWGPYQNKDTIDEFIGDRIIARDSSERVGIWMQPYNLEEKGIIYCGIKHKPLSTTVWCPSRRNKTLSCGGAKDRQNCKVHKHLCKATV